MTTHTDERHLADEAPSRRRCFTAAELKRRRAVAEMPLWLARHLVSHLGHPCEECWRAVLVLRDFEEQHDTAGLPLVPEGLVPSTHPVVLALRTLGGWPPRRWLMPRHRAALDGAMGRLGFVTLVLEEARRVARGDKVRMLGSWVETVKALGGQGPEVAALLARALAYLAEACGAAGEQGSALATLDLADRTVSQRPAPDDLSTVLIITRARLVEEQSQQLARAYLEMVVERLEGTARGDLLAEVRLELVELHLRQHQLGRAQQELGAARRALRNADQPLLAERLKLCWVRWCLLLAKTRPGLLRLAAHGAALGHWATWLGVPATLDPQSGRIAATLRQELAAVATNYTPGALRRALATLPAGARRVPLQTELRVILAGVLEAGGDATGAAAEVEGIEQAFLASPGLALSLEGPRRGLVGQLRDFGHVAAVEGLLRPVVRVLDGLREPKLGPADVEPGSTPAATSAEGAA